jgi:hypothetical protein
MGDYGQNIPQKGDVLHIMNPDGGDMIVNRYIADDVTPFAEVVMTAGLESAILDCWMGGNWNDDGSQATEKNQWCGNEGEREEHKSRGRLQFILNGKPLTSASVDDIEEAARDDIVNQMPKSAVKDAKILARITSPTRVDIDAVIIGADGTVYDLSYKGLGQ